MSGTMEDTPNNIHRDTSRRIYINVLSTNNEILPFRIKMQTPLQKLMLKYCEMTGLNMADLRFKFEGRCISDNDTLSLMAIEEYATIEVYEQHSGGGRPNIKKC